MGEGSGAVLRLGVGLHPDVDQSEHRLVIGLGGEDEFPTGLHTAFLDLKSGEVVAEKAVGFDQAEAPVGLVPPVVILLQLDGDNRPRSCGWA